LRCAWQLGDQPIDLADRLTAVVAILKERLRDLAIYANGGLESCVQSDAQWHK
tara:strand:+ start:473 stop:631 length:159 start_codon:yes stop_codon:yes gene_type:complete